MAILLKIHGADQVAKLSPVQADHLANVIQTALLENENIHKELRKQIKTAQRSFKAGSPQLANLESQAEEEE